MMQRMLKAGKWEFLHPNMFSFFMLFVFFVVFFWHLILGWQNISKSFSVNGLAISEQILFEVKYWKYTMLIIIKWSLQPTIDISFSSELKCQCKHWHKVEIANLKSSIKFISCFYAVCQIDNKSYLRYKIDVTSFHCLKNSALFTEER